MSSMKNLHLEDARFSRLEVTSIGPITSLPKRGDRWGVSDERG